MEGYKDSILVGDFTFQKHQTSAAWIKAHSKNFETRKTLKDFELRAAKGSINRIFTSRIKSFEMRPEGISRRKSLCCQGSRFKTKLYLP